MDAEARWEAAILIRHRLGSATTEWRTAVLMDDFSRLCDRGRSPSGLDLAERLAKIKRGKRMATIEDAKQVEDRLRKAALRGVKDPSALDQPPQRVKDPDVAGNRGSGVYKRPANPRIRNGRVVN